MGVEKRVPEMVYCEKFPVTITDNLIFKKSQHCTSLFKTIFVLYIKI